MKALAYNRGFTLIESVFTIAIIAIAMTGLIAIWSKSVVHSADPYWQSQTNSLGKVYLNQITQQPFSSLDEYAATVNSQANSQIKNYPLFKVRIKLQNAGSEFALASAQLKKVLLTVTSPTGDSQLFVTYKGDI